MAAKLAIARKVLEPRVRARLELETEYDTVSVSTRAQSPFQLLGNDSLLCIARPSVNMGASIFRASKGVSMLVVGEPVLARGGSCSRERWSER